MKTTMTAFARMAMAPGCDRHAWISPSFGGCSAGRASDPYDRVFIVKEGTDGSDRDRVTAYPRLRMRWPLAEQPLPGAWRSRAIGTDDAPALGALMLAAYHGTVDDEGKSEADAIAEVERTLAGEYGPFLENYSFAVDEGSRIAGASMVSLWERGPGLTNLIVHPDVRRRGLGTFLMAMSGNALVSAGYSELDLFVTEGNLPAMNLYRKLGFQVVDRITHPDP